jgi:hypothetical protein
MSSLNPYNPAFAQFLREAEGRYNRMLFGLSAERRGQAYFNTLATINPELADQIAAGGDDPFYDDARLPHFLARIAELLEEA